MSDTTDGVQRWSTLTSSPAELGGFVAYGDYLEIKRQLAEAQAETKRLEEERKLTPDDLREKYSAQLSERDAMLKANAEIIEAAEEICSITPVGPKAITYDGGWHILDLVQDKLCKAVREKKELNP